MKTEKITFAPNGEVMFTPIEDASSAALSGLETLLFCFGIDKTSRDNFPPPVLDSVALEARAKNRLITHSKE